MLLIDLDGTLADFEQGFINTWKKLYPGVPHLPKESRKCFYLHEEYPEEQREKVLSVYRTNFYLETPPLPGAVEAIHEMENLGIDFRICTAPPSIEYAQFEGLQNQVSGKYWWVKKFLGEQILKKIVISGDKTIIRGKYLIDDKPKITGSLYPAWEHIIFDQPYNKRCKGRRINWDNWKEIILEEKNANV